MLSAPSFSTVDSMHAAESQDSSQDSAVHILFFLLLQSCIGSMFATSGIADRQIL